MLDLSHIIEEIYKVTKEALTLNKVLSVRASFLVLVNNAVFLIYICHDRVL